MIKGSDNILRFSKMGFALGCSLLWLAALCTSFADAQMLLKGTSRCILEPNNLMSVEIEFYDVNNHAIRFVTLNDNNITMTQCANSGQGTLSNNWKVETRVNLNTNQETNPCGLTTGISTSGSKVYSWKFRSFMTPVGAFFQGPPFTLNANCDVAMARGSGYVSDMAQFTVPPYIVTPADPKSVTGDNTYASGSEVNSIGSFYPESSNAPAALQGADGVAFTNCYSATNENMNQNRDQFIDANGCPINGSMVEPSGAYERTGLSSDRPIRLETTIIAKPINGKKTIYIECEEIIRCETADHERCKNPCDAYNNGVDPAGTSTTGVSYQTSFNVQDKKALNMYPGRQTDPDTPLVWAYDASSAILYAKWHPYGIGAPAGMKKATGMAIKTCYASTESDYNTYEVIVRNGCAVSNGLVNLTSGFTPAPQHSVPAENLFALSTTRFILSAVPGNVLYVKCTSSICSHVDHSQCKKGACGQSDDMPAYMDDLGFVGLEFELSIIRSTDPAVDVQTTDNNGNPTNPGTVVNIGGPGLNFKTLFRTGGVGYGKDAVDGAGGAYLHSCNARVVAEDGTVSNYQMVDPNACPVSSSPVKFSEHCTQQNTGPVITVSCGKVQTTLEGNHTITCEGGTCPDAYCDRCAAGTVNPDDLRFQNIQGTPSTYVSFKAKDRGIGNTATDSEARRVAMVVAAILAPLIFTVGISVLTCCCLRWQKKGRIC